MFCADRLFVFSQFSAVVGAVNNGTGYIRHFVVLDKTSVVEY